MALILALLLPCLAVGLWLPRPAASLPGGGALRMGLSMLLGLGLSSCVHFLWLIVGKEQVNFWTFEVAVWLPLCLAGGWRWRRAQAEETVSSSSPAHPLLVGGVLLLCITGTAAFMIRQTQFPHSDNDGVAMWNFHARVLYLDPQWQQFLATPLGFDPAKDYPLLVPGSVARLWHTQGAPDAWVQSLVAYWFAMGGVFTCYGIVALARGRNQGLLIALMLLGTSFFIKHAANQYADAPLACLIGAALGLVQLSWERQNASRGLLLLGGMAAGLAAWTKNEGLLFAMALLAAHAAVSLTQRDLKRYVQEAILLLAGAAVPLLCVVYYKLGISSSSYFVEGRGAGSFVEMLSNPVRYWTVASTMAHEGYLMGKGIVILLPFYFLWMGLSRTPQHKFGRRLALLTLALVLAGDFFVYVITPLPLDWHLTSSARRVLLQLWPALLITFFLNVATPEEHAVAASDLDEADCPRRLAA